MGILDHRVALVTGAGRGIGMAIARALAAEGAAVAIGDIDEAAAQSAAQGLQTDGFAAMAVAMDVADRGSVHRAVAQIEGQWLRVDILVNNAGICINRPFEEVEETEWDRVLDIDLKGAFLCTQAVIKGMRERRYGRIINISSVAGKMGGYKVGVHYAAAKAGIIGLTFNLARNYARQGITVNVVAPGTVLTDMTRYWSEKDLSDLANGIAMGRLGEAHEIAAAVLFLASDAASFITGEVLDVNGGQWTD